MMRVDQAGGQRPEFPEPNRKKKKTDLAAAQGRGPVADPMGTVDEVNFSETFIDKAAQKVTQSLDKLMDDLARQGEALVRQQTFAELEKYKVIIQDFLTKVTQELYHLHESGNENRGGKVYVILEKVDEKVDLLTKEVLGKQAPQLNIMKRLDEIRGLLMDLYK